MKRKEIQSEEKLLSKSRVREGEKKNPWPNSQRVRGQALAQKPRRPAEKTKTWYRYVKKSEDASPEK